MAGASVWWTCVVRVAFVVAAFDAYFGSVVVGGGSSSGLTRWRSTAASLSAAAGTRPAPARRLVLAVADGLRADSFAAAGRDRAPHLRLTVEERGTWGVSHTRVPTESRPGHVAIIAGFYEDPSAVTRGWKENPVHFDSLFNRSRHVWSWGSPDILPMFAKGATGDRVYTHTYSHEEEDFSGKKNTGDLDRWVFDRVEEFFRNVHHDSALASRLNGDKIVFFLHLLGLDTAGHTHKPHSAQYRDNIKTVDEGIARIETIIDDFYQHDGLTAYIFTSDHGMTDWGSHGAGSAHETETPLVAWGAGVASAGGDGNRIDVNQVDVCPLMATLIGVDVPVDSIGTLPDTYLNVTSKDKACFFYKNMEQMLIQYDLKRQRVESTAMPWIYVPFRLLSDEKIIEKLATLESLFRLEKFERLIMEIKNVMRLCSMGSDYYQNYYQNILLKCVTMSFLGWIFWLLTILLQHDHQNDNSFRSDRFTFTSFSSSIVDLGINFVFGLCLLLSFYLIYGQRLPVMYYVHFSLPLYHWWKVFTSWRIWFDLFKKINNTTSGTKSSNGFVSITVTFFIYLTGVFILIMSFFYRWSLSIGLLGLATFPLFEPYRKNNSLLIKFCWFFSSIMLALFLFLPVIGKQDNSNLVAISGLLWFCLSLISLQRAYKMEKMTIKKITVASPSLMIVAIINKYYVADSFSTQNGLPIVSQCISWILALSSLVLPLFSSSQVIYRLFSIYTNLSIFFILLSVAHEGFFLLVLCLNLSSWLIIEHNMSNNAMEFSQWSFSKSGKFFNQFIVINRKNLNAEDFRRSFIFLMYIILAFFGTGNIASINSFDPQWVRCFVAQFSPFLMMGLILCKTLIPFLCVTCTFHGVNLVANVPIGRLFTIMLIYSDLMSIYFLHKITNTGSWLDIGTSISHYVVVQSMVFFVSLLYGIAYFMTRIGFLNSRRLKDV